MDLKFQMFKPKVLLRRLSAEGEIKYFSGVFQGDRLAIGKPRICNRDGRRSDTPKPALSAGVLVVEVSVIGCDR